VYLAARSEQKAITAIAKIRSSYSSAQIEFLHLDLESLESVRTTAETFLRNEDKLDILICNAGIIAKDVELTVDGIEMDFQINYLGKAEEYRGFTIGHFYLSRLLLQAMNQSTDARLVLVSSDAYYKYLSNDTKFESLDDVNENKWFLKRYGTHFFVALLIQVNPNSPWFSTHKKSQAESNKLKFL